MVIWNNFLKRKSKFLITNRYSNFFDYIVLGFYSKNIINNVHEIAKKNFKLIIELSYYMSCFTDKQKEESINKIKDICKENNYVLEDTSSKSVWKFIYKQNTESIDNSLFNITK